MHQVQPSRDSRLGQHGFPNKGDAHALVAGKQKLPSRRLDFLGFHLKTKRSMRANALEFNEPIPFFQRQTQVRIRERSPAVSVGRSKFLTLVPRGSRFGSPLLTRDRRRSLQRKDGLNTRGVLLRNVDVKYGIAGRQVTLHGNTNNSRKQPLAHIGEAHCQPADPLVLKPATHTGDSVQRTERDLKQLFPEEAWNKLHLQIIFYGREYCTARGCDGTVCPLCTELYPNRRKPVIWRKP